MKLNITGANGLTVAVVDAHKFTVYVDNIAYQFAYHDAHDRSNQLVVTDPKSGMRVCLVPYTTRLACTGDDKAAAKMAVNQLVARVGGERFRKVVDNALEAAK